MEAARTPWNVDILPQHYSASQPRSFTHKLLYPRSTNPWYPLDRRLGGPQSWPGLSGEEKDEKVRFLTGAGKEFFFNLI